MMPHCPRLRSLIAGGYLLPYPSVVNAYHGHTFTPLHELFKFVLTKLLLSLGPRPWHRNLELQNRMFPWFGRIVRHELELLTFQH